MVWRSCRLEVALTDAMPVPFPRGQIRVDLPLVGHRASDIYGRVKKSTKGELRYFCGIEFTVITGKTRSSIELLVQLLMQTMESD